MAVFGHLLLYVFLIPFLSAFLLDDKTPSPNNGLSDKHYIAVMELLAEETKARQQLEVAVTELHRDLVTKTSNIASFQNQENIIKDLRGKLQHMENKTDMLEQNQQHLKSENVAISKGYSAIQQRYLILERNYSTIQSQHVQLLQKLSVRENKSAEIVKELNALKQLKAIGHLQDIHALKSDTETLKSQVHSLTANQAARGQDFLALYNQTLAFRSDLALDIVRMSKQNNDSSKDVMRNLQKGK